ncbi:hypothetical protein YC2023_102246 [Brassica napus]
MRSTVRGRVKCVVRAERENREALGQSESDGALIIIICITHSGFSANETWADKKLISGAPVMTSSIMVSEMKRMRNE